MGRFLVRRLLRLLLVLWAVSAITFVAARQLPGQPVDITIAGPGATEGQLAQVRHQWALDRALPVQYARWLGNVATGDLGRSAAFNIPVSRLIRHRIAVSLELMLAAQLLALLMAVPLGLWAAARANSVADRAITGGTLALLSLPPVVCGPLLVWIFALRLGWLPALYSEVHWVTSPWQSVRSLALPSLTLAVSLLAVYVRLLRSDVIRNLKRDFIVTAQAKGLSRRQVLVRHALRPSLASLLTATALNVGVLVGGAVIVEFLFSIPGMGSLTLEAVSRHDLQLLQLCIVVLAAVVVTANLLGDLAHRALDPRVRAWDDSR
ncbi:MAG: binding-protein-dependent transport system inner rane component [Acidimicrobiia bacterium]|nr:binding-protein-dependent transport system inner rane component [Acidimicrobiia bacterium]